MTNSVVVVVVVVATLKNDDSFIMITLESTESKMTRAVR